MTNKPFKINLIPDVPDSTKEEALNPTANLIGQAFRGITHKVLDPLVRYNIVKDEEMKDFAAKVKQKTSETPLEYRDSSKLGLTLKSVEDSAYQLNSEELRDMFSSLIAASVDSRINEKVHPSFSTTLKDLSPDDAKIFKEIYLLGTIPSVTVRIIEQSSGSGVNIIENILIMDGYYLQAPETLNTLSNFGLITILSGTFLSSTTNKEKYDKFEESDIYLREKAKLPFYSEDLLFDKIEVKKGKVELTPIGKQFGSIVLS